MSLHTIKTEDVIDKLPLELQARLESAAYFCDVTIALVEKGSVAREIAAKQSVLATKNGKRGAAVLVLQIVATDEYPEQAFGPLTLYPSFEVIEQVELNNDASGTKKSARKIAREIIRVLKPVALEGICTDLQVDKPALEPLSNADDIAKNLVRYGVNFKCYECETNSDTQVANVIIDQVGETITLTCSTAGSTIYYTTDDSPPWKGNHAAVAYSAPIGIPSDGVTIRACAFAAGVIDGNTSRANITP